ncbi:MAG: T9SS type A sorting domain-containing protein, partial [Bacteroidia bacterium]|nr:T9SS type A sorting domain-containing protein [Bacteroidia bacterium]NNM15610.1 T9SS type A sorting domain-containing protein [Bacteroidia bacterium]
NAAFNSHISLELKECEVDGAQLKQPYIGQNTIVGTKGFAAVIAHDAILAINKFEIKDNNGNITGYYDNNEFKNLSNGIIANKCNLFLENNKFENINADPAYANKYNGTAIFASDIDLTGLKPPGFYSLNQTGFGSDVSAGDPASFSNCDYGIVAEKMNVNSTNNNMNVIKAGYSVKGSGGREVYLADNFIQSNNDGIQLLFNDNAESLIVENNTIDFGYLHHGSSTNEIPIHGIIVMDNGTSSSEPQIINNTISSASINAVRSGITLNRASNYEVGGNDVDLHGAANEQGGIRAFGCNNIAINCNTVDGSAASLGPAPDLINRQAGIHVFGAGYSGNVGCNTVDQFHNGILFEGSANNQSFDITGNNFNTHHYGLHLTQSSRVGAQDRRGNLWNVDPVNTTTGENAIYEDPNSQGYPALNPIIVDAIVGTSPIWPNFVQPANWFQPPNPGTSGNFTCDSPIIIGDEFCDTYSPCPWPCNHTDAIDDEVIDGTLQNPPYTDETLYMLQSELYAALNRDSILLNSDSLLQAFYNNSQTEAFATFESVNEELLELYQLDETVYNSLQQNNTTIETLMNDIGTKLEQMQDETLSNADIVIQQNEVSALQGQLSSLINTNNNAVQLAQTSELLTTASLEITNNGAPATETIELNEQSINEVYLNTIAEGKYSFEPTEESTLLSIANQCPLSGGAAVFTARSLYFLIDPNMIYDDRNLCLQQGIILREQKDKTPNIFSVYPNPANNIVNVVYTLNENDNAKFVLYDNLGRQLFEKNLNNNNTQLQLDVSNINSGIYFYVIYVNKAQEYKGKIVIAR